MLIEVCFPTIGQTIASDHGYSLYAALSGVLPELHGADNGIAIGPIGGAYVGGGKLQLDPRRSKLRLRLPAEKIPTILPLAGKSLDVAGDRIRLGVPQVQSLVPAASLHARQVTIKASGRTDPLARRRYMEPEAFLDGVRKQLADLDINGVPAIPLVQAGPHAGNPSRKTLRVKDKRIVGFSLLVTGLSADESILLQEHGLGGRRKLGCGFFVPAKG